VNRITRVREWGVDLFGKAQNRIRVVRTSNAYTFVDPKPSKSDLLTGTAFPESVLEKPRQLDPANRLHRALMRLGVALQGEADERAASGPNFAIARNLKMGGIRGLGAGRNNAQAAFLRARRPAKTPPDGETRPGRGRAAVAMGKRVNLKLAKRGFNSTTIRQAISLPEVLLIARRKTG